MEDERLLKACKCGLYAGRKIIVSFALKTITESAEATQYLNEYLESQGIQLDISEFWSWLSDLMVNDDLAEGLLDAMSEADTDADLYAYIDKSIDEALEDLEDIFKEL